MDEPIHCRHGLIPRHCSDCQSLAAETATLRSELERVKAENASALESVANLRRQFRVSRKDCRRLTAKAESFDAIWDVCVELGMKVNPPGVDGDGERIDEEWANQFAFLRDLRTRAESAEASLAEANARAERAEAAPDSKSLFAELFPKGAEQGQIPKHGMTAEVLQGVLDGGDESLLRDALILSLYWSAIHQNRAKRHAAELIEMHKELMAAKAQAAAITRKETP